jgi:hypothetical protein
MQMLKESFRPARLDKCYWIWDKTLSIVSFVRIQYRPRFHNSFSAKPGCFFCCPGLPLDGLYPQIAPKIRLDAQKQKHDRNEQSIKFQRTFF